MSVIEIFKKRRTQYALGDRLPLARSEVEHLIREAVREAPSAFNSQSSRVVILFGDEHRKLWNIVKDTLRDIVPAENFPTTEAKIDSFAKGAGSVLFFEDQKVVRQLQENFPLYADKFPVFSDNAAGMAQFAVWTTLAQVGIGASLQHYHPLIDEQVAETWGLPKDWHLSAQMPFGSHEQDIAAKDYMENDERFRVFG